MKKASIFLSIMVVLTIVLFFGVKLLENSKSDEDIIINHLEDEKFVYDEDGGYYKKNYSNNTMSDYYNDVKEDKKANYEELYFYLGLTRYNQKNGKYEDNYVFDKVKMTYEDDIHRNYTGNYNLIDEFIKYKYEVTMYSSTIIVSGEYDVKEKDSFTCVVDSDRDMDNDDSDVFCTRAKYETLSFLEQAKEIMKNPKFSEVINN